MPLPHKGSWFGLPDFGITERFSGNRTAQGGSNLVGPKQAYSPPQPQPITNYGNQNVQQPSVLGASTNRARTSSSQQIPTNQQPYEQIQQQQDNGFNQIEADFSQAMSIADSAEQGLRGQAGSAEAQITNDAAGVKTELESGKTTQQQGVNTSLQSAEKQGTSAMQQARDLFRQTQQSNIAQLSAMGISSSSVSEALAERLGVETARRIAGVSGSIEEVRQNATSELGRINKYYTEKSTQLAENVRIQKDQIQQSLVQGLNQINSARQQAASAKASARANLLSQVQEQIYSLTAQQQQFDQSLQAWAQQKAAALTPIAQDPNYVQNLIAQTQNLNQQFAPTGFVATPSFNVNKEGTYTGQINFNKKPDDEMSNPFLTPGA